MKKIIVVPMAAVLINILNPYAFSCNVSLGGNGCSLYYENYDANPPDYHDNEVTGGSGCGFNPGHPTSNSVELIPWTEGGVEPIIHDQGGWAYHYDPADPYYGEVDVDCGHEDQRGVPWVDN